MVKKEVSELITQTEAARIKGMSLAAINELVRRGSIRSEVTYGKRLVYRADVLSFTPRAERKQQSSTKKSAKKGKG